MRCAHAVWSFRLFSNGNAGRGHSSANPLPDRQVGEARGNEKGVAGKRGSILCKSCTKAVAGVQRRAVG